MDAFFFFLIPKDSDVAPFEFKIPMFMWDGIDYPQGPPECKFGTNFKLRFDDDNLKFIVKSLKSLLPSSYGKMDWQYIEVVGDGVHIYRDTLYQDDKKEETDFSLQDLVNTMLHNKPLWAVGFEKHYDDGFQVRGGDVKDVMGEMDNSLKLINNRGFLLYKQNATTGILDAVKKLFNFVNHLF